MPRYPDLTNANGIKTRLCRILNLGPSAGKIHWRNTRDQLMLVGPKSLGVALLTAGFVGMVFTIQVSVF
jgi:ABC-type transporter Mla maintaining outer membrane lipid asymmetry permease subunit MlaE